MSPLSLKLSPYDEALLRGEKGEAAKRAMRIIVEMARIQQAEELTDIAYAHIGGSVYTGEHSLEIIESLAELGGKVVVPTTMNAISLDRKRWREQGIEASFANNADRLVKAYEKMGVQPTFSCTPYVFPEKPQFGDDIVWAESNAIAYANSVLGARTNRHGDFLDICAALTGRAPKSGLHLKENRYGTFLVNVPNVKRKDVAFYTVLGYAIGRLSKEGIPVIQITEPDLTTEKLKAFSATISTAGPVGLYHIVGVTPEARTLEEALNGKEPEAVYDITIEDLENTWQQLSTTDSNKIEMIVMGSPHFTLDECQELAELVDGKTKDSNVDFLITTSTYIFNQAKEKGFVEKIEQFGARFSTDICLCMLNEMMLRDNVEHVMTNSGKFAHYGPGLISRRVIFSDMEQCVQTAVQGGKVTAKVPDWI